ncbi:MAG: hypothetical protein WCI06_02870 [Methylococcaceae bacterium]
MSKLKPEFSKQFVDDTDCVKDWNAATNFTNSLSTAKSSHAAIINDFSFSLPAKKPRFAMMPSGLFCLVIIC